MHKQCRTSIGSCGVEVLGWVSPVFVSFIHACAATFIVGGSADGIGVPRRVPSDHLCKLGRKSEAASICPHKVRGEGWNQSCIWAS